MNQQHQWISVEDRWPEVDQPIWAYVQTFGESPTVQAVEYLGHDQREGIGYVPCRLLNEPVLEDGTIEAYRIRMTHWAPYDGKQ